MSRNTTYPSASQPSSTAQPPEPPSGQSPKYSASQSSSPPSASQPCPAKDPRKDISDPSLDIPRNTTYPSASQPSATHQPTGSSSQQSPKYSAKQSSSLPSASQPSPSPNLRREIGDYSMDMPQKTTYPSASQPPVTHQPPGSSSKGSPKYSATQPTGPPSASQPYLSQSPEKKKPRDEVFAGEPKPPQPLRQPGHETPEPDRAIPPSASQPRDQYQAIQPPSPGDHTSELKPRSATPNAMTHSSGFSDPEDDRQSKRSFEWELLSSKSETEPEAGADRMQPLSETMPLMEDYRYRNWAGTQTCTPELYYEPTTVEEIKEIVARARKEGKRVKVQGYGHSPNNIPCTDGYMMYLKKMDAVVDVDKEKRQITVQAGCSLRTLSIDILPKYDMALPVVPAVGEPTIAGAISTGTHASGKKYGNLGSYVIGVKLLTAAGDVITCTREENADTLRAVVCSLGCLGVILEVTLQCDPAFQIHSVVKPGKFDELLERLDTFVEEVDHAKFFWFPHTENVVVFNDNRTKEMPARKESSWFWSTLIGHHFQQFCMWLGYHIPRLQPFFNTLLFKLLFNSTVECVDTSYNLFTYDCLYSHWINECAIPLEKTKEVLRGLKSKLDSSPDVYASYPLEVRFVKGDDGLLSPCQGRDTCLLTIISFRPYNKGGINEGYWKLFEDVIAKAGARPHWGKNHNFSATHLRQVYPEWDKFCAIRGQLDPDGMFLNDHLEGIFGLKSPKKDA